MPIEGNPELDSFDTPESELTPQEVADACRGVLSDEICDDIEWCSNVEFALLTAEDELEKKGIDPDKFFDEKHLFG